MFVNNFFRKPQKNGEGIKTLPYKFKKFYFNIYQKSFAGGVWELKSNLSIPPISVTLKNRADWLWEWGTLRGYNFDSNNRRNTFLYIYFMTWMQAYSNYNLAYAMTHRRNHQLDKQLKATDLDKKIQVWNLPKYNRKFTNETLIRLLEITPEEVVTLKIGYKKT